MDKTTQIGIGIGVFVFVILMIFMFVPMGDCQTDENKYSQFEGGGSTWLKSCKSCPGSLDCDDLKSWQANSCGMSCEALNVFTEAGEVVEDVIEEVVEDVVGSTPCDLAEAAAEGCAFGENVNCVSDNDDTQCRALCLAVKEACED